MRHFERAAQLDPNLAGPHFQLYNAYRDPSVGRADDAARELATFQRLKKQQPGAAIPEDLEWSFFSEIWDPIDPADREPTPNPETPSFDERVVLEGIDARSAAVALLPAGADQKPDAIVWSAAGVRLLAAGAVPVGRAGFEDLRGVVAVAPGDFDNDGLIDLAIVTATEVSLWRGTNRGTFARHGATLPAGPRSFRSTLFIDFPRRSPKLTPSGMTLRSCG